jgi:glycosyltransferase involved in cell wall biosynthesis
MKNRNISVIVPVYNEEETIFDVLQNIEGYMRERGGNYEIIAVNDASTDKSVEIIKSMGSRIKLIEHSSNRGYGAALKTGIKNSNYDLLVIIDGDATYPCDKIEELLRYIDEFDMVVGARIGIDAKLSLIRKIGKWPIVKLAEYLTNIRIPDINSGFRVMKKDIVNKFMNILPEGFSFTTTITLAMLTNNYDVKYIPISYKSRYGKSKFHPIKDTMNFIQLTVKTVMYFNPLKVFLPISLFLFILSFITLLYRFFHQGGLGIITIILFVAGIQIITTGMLADLVVRKNK